MKYNQILVNRLHDWSDWRVRGAEEIGYPGSTVESRLMEYGAVPSVSGITVVPSYMGNRNARDVDQIITTLPGAQRTAIYNQYIWNYHIRRLMQISEYINLLDKAHKKIADSLGIRYRGY